MFEVTHEEEHTPLLVEALTALVYPAADPETFDDVAEAVPLCALVALLSTSDAKPPSPKTDLAALARKRALDPGPPPQLSPTFERCANPIVYS